LVQLADLAPAEFEIMEILWGKGRASTKEVVAALPDSRKLAYNTVATVLARLREKGYVEAKVENFAYVYSPLINRNQVENRKLDDLVNRVLRGNLSALAVYIAKKRKLTPDQIAALEDIIEAKPDKED
jgi:predicted transcriptional regulator